MKLLLIASLALLPLHAETIKGLYVSTPLAISGSYGFLLGDVEDGSAPSVEVEAGLGGYKFLVGVQQLEGAFNTALKAAYMHTWLEPIELDTNQSYLGMEFQATTGSLVGSIGGYRRIEGDDDKWVASLGLGVRF